MIRVTFFYSLSQTIWLLLQYETTEPGNETRLQLVCYWFYWQLVFYWFYWQLVFYWFYWQLVCYCPFSSSDRFVPPRPGPTKLRVLHMAGLIRW